MVEDKAPANPAETRRYSTILYIKLQLLIDIRSAKSAQTSQEGVWWRLQVRTNFITLLRHLAQQRFDSALALALLDQTGKSGMLLYFFLHFYHDILSLYFCFIESTRLR